MKHKRKVNSEAKQQEEQEKLLSTFKPFEKYFKDLKEKNETKTKKG